MLATNAQNSTKITLLEDDLQLQTLISERFAEEGAYQVVCLDNDIKTVLRSRPNCLLVKYDIFERYYGSIAQRNHNNNMLVVVYSLEDKSQHAVKSLKLGANDFVVLDPKRPENLIEAIKRAFEEKKMQVSLEKEANDLKITVDKLANNIRKRARFFLDTNNSLQKEVETHQQKENILQKTLQKLSSHLENSPHGVVEWDKTHKIVSWSRQAELLFGWSAAEVTGRHIPDADFIHQDDRKAVLTSMARLFAGKEKQNISFNKNHTKNGKVVYCEWYNTALFGEDGKVETILSIVNNITSFKMYEQELLASQERFEKLSQASFDGIVIHENGLVLDCNQRYLDMFQRSLDECVGQDTYEFFTKKSKEIILGHIKTQNESAYEVEGIRKNGSIFPLEIVARTISIGDKMLRLGALRDITERKREQALLQESEERFRATFEQAAVGIAHVSQNGLFLRVNQRFCQLSGYTKEQLLAMDASKILDLMENKPDINEIKKVILGEIAVFATEMCLNAPNKQKIWLNCTFSSVHESKQGDTYLMAVVDDISDRKKIESELKVANFEMDKFIYNTSHDLRSPIASIKGLCHIAALEIPITLEHNYIQMIENTASKMDIMLSSLVMLNDIKKRQLKGFEIDLNLFFIEIEEKIRKSKQLDNIDWKLEINVQNPLISDVELLINILERVLDNAFYFKNSKRDSHKINISVKQEGEITEIKITDNGIGIKKELIDNIFDMFFKGTEHAHGAGLGLYMAKHMVTKLNGHIDIKSIYGEYTVVIITLPNLPQYKPKWTK